MDIQATEGGGYCMNLDPQLYPCPRLPHIAGVREVTIGQGSLQKWPDGGGGRERKARDDL